MNDIIICEVWSLFSQYVDKKLLAEAAEEFVELLSDNAVSDEVLRASLGVSKHLDRAIEEYLDNEDGE